MKSIEIDHLQISRALGQPVGIIKTKLLLNEYILHFDDLNDEDDKSLKFTSIYKTHYEMMQNLVNLY